MTIATTLEWRSDTGKAPNTNRTVVVWLSTGEWFSAWWDKKIKRWLDTSSGWPIDGVVTHWADVRGPNHAA